MDLDEETERVNINQENPTGSKLSLGLETDKITISNGKLIVFIVQVLIIYSICAFSLYRILSFPDSENSVFISLLSSSIGILLPTPKLHKKKNPILNSEKWKTIFTSH